MTEEQPEIPLDTVLIHICEACGKTEEMTISDSYNAGWDYPPMMGSFGVVSPRTCGECGIDKTLWWRLTTNPHYQPTGEDMQLIKRIQGEPESITPQEKK